VSAYLIGEDVSPSRCGEAIEGLAGYVSIMNRTNYEFVSMIEVGKGRRVNERKKSPEALLAIDYLFDTPMTLKAQGIAEKDDRYRKASNNRIDKKRLLVHIPYRATLKSGT